MSITYARFKSHELARRASKVLRRSREPARVDLLWSPERLSHHAIPLHMTAARSGVLVGSVMAGLGAILALAGALWLTGVGGEGALIGARGTLTLFVGLSALFGGLAGALSFASDNGIKVQRMRRWLSAGDQVVIVEARRDHEDILRGLGADQVGTFA
ncbi:hypothetical protein G6O69_03720 [Pseudenhygromyxa sp. WMMC2535]|uniref:hypothetical protein n=1 Tax=Pseudenhygromyxa sp. WMMC2535 TaxID=2712867 RepID=UPI001553457C|nr:hypothetical protein [Pseudenhygromyxa sp. WMMC2535]NVB36924.1 hypothetical protein [Pseudenhygromyxa sp. WMMC2535]